MDATQQFADKLGIPVPKTFVVAGASKVNWTALIYLLTQLTIGIVNFLLARLDE